MRQRLIVIIALGLIVASSAIFNSAHAQVPPPQPSCPLGQVPVKSGTGWGPCQPIDLFGRIIGK
jgi:hypothetical protein